MDKKPETPSPLLCTKCQVPLEEQDTRFQYLGHELHAMAPRCPVCGQVYLPEALVEERIATVEAALEDK